MVTRWFTVKRSSFTIIKHESFARDISAIRLLEVSIVSEPLNFRYAVLVAVHGALVLFGCGSAALCLGGYKIVRKNHHRDAEDTEVAQGRNPD